MPAASPVSPCGESSAALPAVGRSENIIPITCSALATLGLTVQPDRRKEKGLLATELCFAGCV